MSYILLGITEALATTSHKALQEKLFSLILIVGSQKSSSFLGMETSNLSFSSLALMRALVICSIKAMFSVLGWVSLAIHCRKPITSRRVQLYKSSSLPLSKVVVMSCRFTCLGFSKFIGVSCSMVEVIASQLKGPLNGLEM